MTTSQPRRDPIRNVLSLDAAETADDLLKEKPRPQPEDRGGLSGVLRQLGPGLIAGTSDDDPSNIGVYAQAGSRFGLGTLWLFLVTAPLMAAVQETCARVALQTGVGLGASLGRKFSRRLVGPLILALVVGNCITLGADLSAVGAGIALLLPVRVPILWLVLPVALVLLLMQLRLTYETIAKTFKYLTIGLFAYVAQAVLLRPDPGRLLAATFVPHLQLSSDFAMIVVAVLGTTLSPYVFFWQASLVVHERRLEGKTTEESRRGASVGKLLRTRADLLVGVVVAQLVMYSLVVSTALVLNAHGNHDVQSASQAAQALTPLAGRFASALFAAGLIGSGLLAIPVLSASSAYVVGEFYDLPGTLGTKARYRPAFYAVLTAAVLAGVLINLVHLNPIQALVFASIIEGLIAAPLLVLIVLLASDRKVMRERASGWLSQALMWIAAAVMSVASVYYLAKLANGHGG